VRVYRLELRHFRGFEEASIEPHGHVVLVGEPGGGRSDVVDGLARVLAADSTRLRSPDELDFFGGDTSKRSEVEATLGELGPDLEQLFFDHLEVWEREDHRIVDELADPQLLDRDAYDFVVRLCYRESWVKGEERADHWVDFPKTSDPDVEFVDRVRQAQREAIPFAIAASEGEALGLGARTHFRRLLEQAEGADFATAVDKLAHLIEEAAEGLGTAAQMRDTLEAILEPLRSLLGLEGVATDHVRFLPAGGSMTGLLRSLGPSVDLKDGAGFLPLVRRGSTVASLFRAGQVLAAARSGQGIVAVDDFGEGLGLAAQHIAAELRRTSSQVWLSTRNPMAAQVFRPQELVRLARDTIGVRRVHDVGPIRSKAERLAARHLHLQLVPAATARAVILVEGPHDRSALSTLAMHLHEEEGVPLPAGRQVAIVDAGAADASGGATALPRLAEAARRLGFRTVAVLDWDRDEAEAERIVSAALAVADVVVRLPKGHAIEFALLVGLPDDVIQAALQTLDDGFGLHLPATYTAMTGIDLVKEASRNLKMSGGLHAQFLEALDPGEHPPLARRLLETAVAAATDAKRSGLEQL
jgi:putative ATP-dependent endonuclease of OLD family